MIEETKDAVGDSCAVAVRFAVQEYGVAGGLSSDGEGREVVEMLADLPDLWDVNISDYRNDSGSSRFFAEGSQEAYTSFVKKVTKKPVVGVGRYTTPDAMVAAIKGQRLDMIGAARPSIADPFLPKKIEEGREDEIRECIGCNICRATFKACTAIRCTQNPTMGEEWRRGWHPERIRPKTTDDPVLVVGAGPAGLECALALGQRGYEVTLAEGAKEAGGHIALAARLPGLAAWGRVRDYRLGRISQMPNVRLYLESRMTAEEVVAFGCPRVVLATGARWRDDGIGRSNLAAIEGLPGPRVFTPESVIAGAEIESPVVVFDDEHYYMASALAERLKAAGHAVTYVTTAPEPAVWTQWTDEHHLLAPHLHALGIEIVVSHNLVAFDGSAAEFAFQYGGRRRIDCATLIPVTSRLPERALYDKLADAAGLASLVRIGDCHAPGLTADAIYAGHRYAEELDAAPGDVLVRRERALPEGCRQ